MDVISFIEKDVVRAKKMGFLTEVCLCTVAVLLPAIIGILSRDSYHGIFDLRVFVPNSMAAGFMSVFPVFYWRKSILGNQAFVFVLSGVGLALLFATERVYFPGALRTIYPSVESFWTESFLCFGKGALMIIFMGGYLAYITFGTSSWPSRRWRSLTAVTSGVSGAIMLGFHCDSSSPEHVLLSHIGPGLLVGTIFFAFLELFFGIRLKKYFPDLSRRIFRFQKIG